MILGTSGSAIWQFAAETMVGHLAHAIHTERPSVRVLPREMRERITKIADCAEAIVEEMRKVRGEQVLFDAFAAFAPHGPNELDDASGFMYLASLGRRARAVADAIPRRQGPRSMGSAFGCPSARLLCAAMVRLAFARAGQDDPNDKKAEALDACTALWRAAGGTRPGGEGSDEAAPTDDGRAAPNSRGDTDHVWERHLRDVREGKKPEAAAALSIARECLPSPRRLRHESI